VILVFLCGFTVFPKRSESACWRLAAALDLQYIEPRHSSHTLDY